MSKLYLYLQQLYIGHINRKVTHLIAQSERVENWQMIRHYCANRTCQTISKVFWHFDLSREKVRKCWRIILNGFFLRSGKIEKNLLKFSIKNKLKKSFETGQKQFYMISIFDALWLKVQKLQTFLAALQHIFLKQKLK